jgi:hypothetical protein
MTTSKPERRRCQFSLRTLLLATVVLAILFGYWGNEKRWEVREAKAKAEIRKLGGKIIPAEIGLGHFSVEEVSLSGVSVTDEDLAPLGQLRHPNGIDLSDTNITDAGLEHLKGLTKLKRLDLRKTRVTDEGTDNLQKALPNCTIYR